jgi:outer membrane lipoprotein SlyB
MEKTMKTRIQASIAATLVALVMGGCSGMTHQEKSTVVGAVGGAVVGGVVGHEVGKK